MILSCRFTHKKYHGVLFSGFLLKTNTFMAWVYTDDEKLYKNRNCGRAGLCAAAGTAPAASTGKSGILDKCLCQKNGVTVFIYDNMQ